MGGVSQVFNRAKPYLAMISLQFGYAGMYIITMVGLKRGLSHWILVVYRHAVATLVIAPFALVLERSAYFFFFLINFSGFLATYTLTSVNNFIILLLVFLFLPVTRVLF